MPSTGSPLEAVISLLRSRPRGVAVASDYDGTLAPIVEDPAQAYPDPDALEYLGALARQVALVAVISGRPSHFLEERIALAGVAYIGLYGLETFPSKELVAWKSAIEEVRCAAEELVSTHPDAFSVEPKGLSVVVHYRRAPDRALAARKARDWANVQARRLGLRVLEGKMVVELVPPVPLGKGKALEHLLEHGPPDLEAVVFLGDDSGDFEAFEAVGRWASKREGRVGLRVAVASEELDPILEHAADVVIPTQRDVAPFLERLSSAADHRNSASSGQ